MMKKIIFLLALPLFILSCGDTPKIEPCFEAMEIVPVNELPDGTIESEVIGEVSSLESGRTVGKIVVKV